MNVGDSGYLKKIDYQDFLNLGSLSFIWLKVQKNAVAMLGRKISLFSVTCGHS